MGTCELCFFSGPGFFTDILVLNFAGEWQMGCLLDFYVDVEKEGALKSVANDATAKPLSLKYEKRTEALKYVFRPHRVSILRTNYLLSFVPAEK